MRTSLKVALIVLGLTLAWYLVSPLFISVEVEESSPLDDALVVKDAMKTMSASDKEAFVAAVEKMKDDVKEMDDAMPKASLVKQATFMASAHEVEGELLLIEKEGKKFLRFEDFNTVNGPELHVYLSTELGDEDIIDLGIIKGTKGNFNYELDDSIDIERYSKVLVWCKPFRVLFSYADLDE
ncbi:MAG: DM13 domain-containing protein [Nanoarchaeota archaeon]|nr:DM13 domain-containing protein [Nanoarchaeota archaeon]